MKNSFSRGVLASCFERHQLAAAAVLCCLAVSSFAQQAGSHPAGCRAARKIAGTGHRHRTANRRTAINKSLPSRRSRQAELGWKSLWQGGKLTSDIAVYRLDLTNMISSQGIVANAFAFDVTGATRSQALKRL